jgi:transposase
MIYLTSQSRILLATEPADFRCGIDGFSARCRLHLDVNPQSGALYVFVNRNKTMIRALRFDGTGFWLMTKRLSKGKFRQWPSPKYPKLQGITAVYLRQLLSGNEPVAGNNNATYVTLVK